MKSSLLGLTKDELLNEIKKLDETSYRVSQLIKWIYQKMVFSFDEMTDLPLILREKLDELYTLSLPKILDIRYSSDKSYKFLLELEDKEKIEMILMPEGNKTTLCISSQVGCPLGCIFCLTGKMGFRRNLSCKEILAQFILAKMNTKRRITNIVFMGMGEPLLNYDNVLKAIEIMTCREGFGLSLRRITISTAGVVPAINRLGKKNNRIPLAVSLNASDNKTRDYLMPINRKYPLDILIETLRKYPIPPRMRITFEYVLIKDINDSPSDAINLAKLIKGIKCKINLIPFNEMPEIKLFKPDDKTIYNFQKLLISKNFTTLIRQSRGKDIKGACGQLAVSL